MIRWLLDTNVVIELSGPVCGPRVQAWFANDHETGFGVSVLTLAELAKGVTSLAPGGPKVAVFGAQLAAIEARFAGRVLPVDREVALRFGYLSGLLRRSGRNPPVIDTLLAATAIEHGLVLVTRNTKDVAATGASLFDPWQQPAAGAS